MVSDGTACTPHEFLGVPFQDADTEWMSKLSNDTGPMRRMQE
jgi:hypothetical protein